MTAITLSGLYIYPIKSVGGIAVEHATLTPRGLAYDRRWMVVTPDGTFMTQRKFPKMALITVRPQDDDLVISAPAIESLRIPLHPEQSGIAVDERTVEVWGDRCLAWSMGHDAKTWFSTVLDTPCELVYMPEESDRPTDHGKFGRDAQVSFADAYPFLLISEASLEDLNQRLATPIPMNRFRPNLVVSGCGAFAEDQWTTLRIGNIPFRVAKPCSRCTIPTVDQATGERSPEPLKTLATYRHWDGQIWFGQNLIHNAMGTLRVGDPCDVAFDRQG